MSKPAANLSASLRKKAAEPARSGGVASTFRKSETKGPTKKATYDLPVDLHRTLHLHAVSSGVPMRELVVRYLHAGLSADGVELQS